MKFCPWRKFDNSMILGNFIKLPCFKKKPNMRSMSRQPSLLESTNKLCFLECEENSCSGLFLLGLCLLPLWHHLVHSMSYNLDPWKFFQQGWNLTYLVFFASQLNFFLGQGKKPFFKVAWKWWRWAWSFWEVTKKNRHALKLKEFTLKKYSLTCTIKRLVFELKKLYFGLAFNF